VDRDASYSFSFAFSVSMAVDLRMALRVWMERGFECQADSTLTILERAVFAILAIDQGESAGSNHL
jgi:hypothetical protein